MFRPKPKFLPGRHEFLNALRPDQMAGSLTTPSGSALTVVDTETCLSVIPNLSAAIDDQTGVTFGGSNNLHSFALDYSWACYTGFDFAPFANSGYVLLLKDGNGRYAWGFMGAAGTGEVLGSDLLAGWDFTSGWTAVAGTAIIDNNSFSTSAINKFIFKNILTANVLYFFSINGSVSTGTCGIYDGEKALKVFCSLNSTGYGVAPVSAGYALVIKNTAIATTDITAFSCKQVTSPPTTAVKIYRDAARTVNGWNKPSAFDMNNASYTFGIHEALSGGKMFFMSGKSTGAWGDPKGVITKPITRKSGLIIAFKISTDNILEQLRVGIGENTTFLLDHSFLLNDSRIQRIRDVVIQTCGTFTANTEITLCIITRTVGAFYYQKVGTGNFKLVGVDSTGSTATMYCAVTNNTKTGTFIDFIRPCNYRHLPPPILSDSFAGADGSADGRLSNGLGHLETTGIGSGGAGVEWSGGGAISTNKLVITPTLGVELLTNPDFEGSFTDGLAASWTKQAEVTPIEETVVVHGGSKAQAFTSSATGKGISQSKDIALGVWMLASVWIRKTSGTVTLQEANGRLSFVPSIPVSGDGVWEQKIYTGRAAIAGFSGPSVKTGNTDNTVYMDDASMKQITLSSCLQTVLLPTKNITMTVKFRSQAGTQCGLVIGLDSPSNPQNMIMAYHDGTMVKTDLCEAGAYTNISTPTLTRVDDAELTITRDNDVIAVHYNNALASTSWPLRTLSAGENSNTSGLYVGLFSTSSLNSFSSAVAYYTGTGNEINILDRIIGGA